MRTELNDARKILVSTNDLETLSYVEIPGKLTDHFDVTRNMYAESIKFHMITLRTGESSVILSSTGCSLNKCKQV